jgi:hypothetical protein
MFRNPGCEDVVANWGGLQGSNSPDTKETIDSWTSSPLQESALSAKCKAA